MKNRFDLNDALVISDLAREIVTRIKKYINDTEDIRDWKTVEKDVLFETIKDWNKNQQKGKNG